ncbi:glutamate receptor 2.8-like [Ziziphus jujuba]|uniref:Glutamate receptor 2.8-like n=1 Tax=Ziziphus jujuba TaxID=326968 RepID=A0ABM4A7V3_ZIZJJ|nr:glutamate receptor 2.8-like [Ziziphus jujuba]
MLVKVKVDQRKNIWIFLKPLRWDLWLTCGAAFLFTGIVVWILEHHSDTDLRDPPVQRLSTNFLFFFLTPLLVNGKKVKNNWTKFVLVIWVFVILIITQSYTASLATILTVQRMQPLFADINELRMNNYVGYRKNSYVRDLLTGQLNFNESRLKSYVSLEEFHQALSKGSKNGGVDAIIDEIPFFKLFLSKYCSGYTMAGPIYKSDGFGFAFQIGSPLVPYISRAILNVTEDYKKMQELERCFDHLNICQNSSSISSENSPSLSASSFGGLFIITGVASLFPCLICLVKFHSNNLPTETISLLWSKISHLVGRLFYGDLPLRTQSSMIYRDDEHEASILRNTGDNLQSHSTFISQGLEMAASDEENESQHVDSQPFIN